MGLNVKKKILFIAPNLRQGGAESVLIKIINNFDKNHYDIKLVLLKKTGKLINLLDKEVEIVDLNIERSILSPMRLFRILKIEKPDVVFSIIGQINLILALLKITAFKDILFIGRENAVYSEWLFKEKNFKKWVMYQVYKILLKKLDFVIVQSEFMEDQVKKLFNVPETKIKVLHNPIEYHKIRSLMNENITDENWDESKINLLAVGRIEKVKNYREMIDIIKTLPEEFHLNILGEGNERDDIENYITEQNVSDRVSIHGFATNPYKYMKSSFALLLTSYRESFPNVVIEANACGTLAISYDMPGGISEIINSDEKNGYIVQYGSKVKMREIILEVYQEGYDRDSVKNSSSKYSIKEYLKEIYHLINGVK